MPRVIMTDRKKTAVGKHWTARDRVRAVAAYLVLGNMARVSEQTGIPLGTLNFWKTQPWFFEQVEKIRSEENMEVDNNFTKIVKKTQEIILDRLENGDSVVTKDGDLVLRPVSAKDASLIGAVSFDKRKILRDIPAQEQNKIGMSERLAKLEMQFTKLVDREEKTIEGEVVRLPDETLVEGEVIYAEDSGTTGEPVTSEGEVEVERICDSDVGSSEVGELEAGFEPTDSEGSEAGEHDSGGSGEGSTGQVLEESQSVGLQVQLQDEPL